MDTTEKTTTLRQFNAAVSREAHHIASHPELCWQQIYNRLQWDGGDVAQTIQLQYQQRATADSRPWLRMRTPFRESQFLMRTLQGHTKGVNACVVSRDVLIAASAGDDYSLAIWDLTNGELRLKLTGAKSPMTACALSSDGRRVIGAEMTGAISVWNLSTGELEFEIDANSSAIYGCDLSRDDLLLATACADGVARIWDLDGRSVAAELASDAKEAHDCKFTPDGKQLIVAGDGGVVRVWDVATQAEVETLKTNWHYSVRACAVSTSGKLVAAVDDRASLMVWELATGKMICDARKDAGHHPFYWAAPGRSGVIGCAIDPTDTFAVSPAYDRTLTVWEIDTGKELATLQGHSGWVRSCAISSDGKTLVSAATDNTLLVWDLSQIEASQSSAAGKSRYQPIKGCAFSPDGWRAASTCEDKGVTIWDVNENAELRTFVGGHMNDFLDCQIDPEGKVVVTTSTDNTLAVRTIEDGVSIASLVGHDVLEYPYFGVYSCAFTPNGRFLVSAGGDKTLKIWDTDDWSKPELAQQSDNAFFSWGKNFKSKGSLDGHADRVLDCAISASGAEVVSASFDGTVRIWDLASFAELAILRGHKGPVYSCAVSPDDRYVLSGGGGGKISKDFKLRLWDLRNRMLIGALAGHTAPVQGCAFSPDGMLCASVSDDGTLKLWRLASLEPVTTFFLSGTAHCVAFHPWRPLIACGDHGGNFFLLDLLGIELGPIIVTPRFSEVGRTIRCPGCGSISALDQAPLAQSMTCTECSLRLRINPFGARV